MKTLTEQRARSFTELRDLCGYIENGGGTTVKIYQDDATRTWHVELDGKSYWAYSLQGAIKQAHAVHHELIQPEN